MDVISSLVAVLTNTTVLLALLVVTVCALLRHVFIDRSNGLPPGPRCRLPIIGNLYAVEPDMRKFLRRYRKKYGDIYSLYLGNKFVIIIAGYDKIKEAFLKNADVFSDRPKERDLISTITDGKGTCKFYFKHPSMFSMYAVYYILFTVCGALSVCHLQCTVWCRKACVHFLVHVEIYVNSSRQQQILGRNVFTYHGTQWKLARLQIPIGSKQDEEYDENL